MPEFSSDPDELMNVVISSKSVVGGVIEGAEGAMGTGASGTGDFGEGEEIGRVEFVPYMLFTKNWD